MSFLSSLFAVALGLVIGLPWVWWHHREAAEPDPEESEPAIHFEPPADRDLSGP